MYEIIATVMEPGPDGCKLSCVTWAYDGISEGSTKQRKDNMRLINPVFHMAIFKIQI